MIILGGLQVALVGIDQRNAVCNQRTIPDDAKFGNLTKEFLVPCSWFFVLERSSWFLVPGSSFLAASQ